MRALCATSSGKPEEVEGVEWRPLKRGEKLPQRCIYAGNTSTDGMIFVGRRTDHKESGKINTNRDINEPSMWNLWTHMNGRADPHEAEILVVASPNKIAEWTAICQGDPLPVGTVYVGVSWRGSDLYVGRNISGQCGKLVVDKQSKASGFWSHGGNTMWASNVGDVLVVRDKPETSAYSDLQEQLSYVGQAVENTLRNLHEENHGGFWNVSRGKVGRILQTPPENHWGKKECTPRNEHSDELPQTMHDTIVKAEKWVDFTSLSPPTGKFMTQIKDAICKLGEKAKEMQSKITIRVLFGNIPLKPVDCNAILRELKPTEYSYISLWVGSYRVGLTSWNHSKIIAVDGKYLVQGGHNCWDEHYLKHNPIHDISMEVEGLVTYDAHMFCNKLWRCLIDLNREYTVSKAVPIGERTGISHWPKELCKYPPMYLESPMESTMDGMVPMISIGRHGEIDVVDGVDKTEIVRQRWPVAIRESRADNIARGKLGCAEKSNLNSLNSWPVNTPTSSLSIGTGSLEIPKPIRPTDKHPADSAIRAMLASAQKNIRLSIQDIGCLILPLTEKTPIPGGTWPVDYLEAIAEALFNGVTVEIVLSNILAVPGNMTKWQCRYGNGWTCVDGAAEIAKALKKKHPEIDDDRVEEILKSSLFLTYIRSQKGVNHWPDGANIGNHAKFIIIDDLCYYMGSQNIYVCNLAEWGIIVDDQAETQRTLEQYWNPMWKESYCEKDCPLHEVMAAITVNRDGVAEKDATEEHKELAKQAQRYAAWQVSNANCDADCNQVYDWIKIKSGDEIPAGCVEAGETAKDKGLNFVGRNRGAAGKITRQAADTLNMHQFLAHSQSSTKDAEVLVVRGKGFPAWKPIKRGDPIPEDAVETGVTQADGIVYVGRAQGEAGKIKTNWQNAKEMQRPPDPEVELSWMFGNCKSPLAEIDPLRWSPRLLPEKLAENLETFMEQYPKHNNRPILIQGKSKESKIGFISRVHAIEWLRSSQPSDGVVETVGCCRMEYFLGYHSGQQEEAEILCIERQRPSVHSFVPRPRYDPHAWLPLKSGDSIPSGAVCEGKLCVGRFAGEVGKITTKENGNAESQNHIVMDHFKGCFNKSSDKCEILLIMPGVELKWEFISRNDGIPDDALFASSNEKDGHSHVGIFEGEIGKITLADGKIRPGIEGKMSSFHGHASGQKETAQILRVIVRDDD